MQYVIAPSNGDIVHSRGPWKKHKYLKKIGKRYVYAKGQMDEASTNAKYRMIYGHDIQKPIRQKAYRSSYGRNITRGAVSDRIWGRDLGVGALETIAFTAAGNAYRQHKANKEYRKEKRQLKKELRTAKSSSFGDAIKAMGKRIISNIVNKIKNRNAD